MQKQVTYISSFNTFNDIPPPGQILDPPVIIVVQRLSSINGRWRVNLHIQQVPVMDTHAPKLIGPIAFVCPRHSKNGGGALSVSPVRASVRYQHLVSAQ